MSRKIKSVSFNLNDPMENEMYEYSKKHSNFSTFVKRLIQDSLNKQSETQKQPVQIAAQIPQVPQPTHPTINKNSMRQLI